MSWSPLHDDRAAARVDVVVTPERRPLVLADLKLRPRTYAVHRIAAEL